MEDIQEKSGVIRKWVVPARMIIDARNNVVDMAFTVWAANSKGAQRKIQDRINQRVGEGIRFDRDLLKVVKGLDG